MELKIISSGSVGNCYILETETSALLIEAGVKFSEIQTALNFNLLKVDLCIITHEHKDHSKSINQVAKAGIPILASVGTFKAEKITSERQDYPIKHGQTIRVKEWKISAFKIDHDAAEPLGFIIEHPEAGRILFLTDTYILRFDLGAFDHILIEANYCGDMVEEIGQKKGFDFVNSRRLKSHMSINTASETLSKLDLKQCKNIILIHLSDGLSNEIEFKKRIEREHGKPVTIATKNQTINFNKQPF
jgi:phosphoribosyl 1,2-cyclic phosphodiesterase